MKNYVISLTTAHNRREHIKAEFGKQGIDFEFFDAVTPNESEMVAKRLGLNLNQAFLTDGEKACLLSHVCLWQKMLDDGLDYLAVFEDDVYLGQNAHLFFSHDDWLRDHKLHFVKTETFLQERKLGKGITLTDNRHVYHLKEFHLGTAGYIVSQIGAKQLLSFLKNLPSKQLVTIDRIMFGEFLLSDSLPIYQMVPALVAQEFILYPTQNNMPSSIEKLRLQKRQHKIKRSLSTKIKGELSNVYRKTFGKLARTKITFR